MTVFLKNNRINIEDNMPLERVKRNQVLLTILLLVIIAIYIYPFIATWITIGIVKLPPLFAPDLYRYLNITRLETINPHYLVNPWFGNIVPKSDIIIYDRFGLPIKLFSILSYTIGDNLVLNLFIWHMFWTILIFLSFIWFFKTLNPKYNFNILMLGLSTLLLIDLTSLQTIFSAWINLPSLDGFQKVRLPYMRTFFPQVSIPLIFCYLSLLIKVLKEQTLFKWLILLFIQLLTLISFPYATIMLLGTTLFTFIALIIFAPNKSANWKKCLA
jgi:hypothetical protein